VNTELELTWAQIQTELRAAVDETTYRIWLEPLRALDFAERTLVLEAPPQACGWIKDRFGRALQTCAAAVLGPDVVVDLIGGGQTGSSPNTRAERSPDGRASKTPVRPGRSVARSSPPELGLNPKLTFDQFVIGDCNRLAHAAALTVAEMPAQAYNPLFICGPPGVGKTHLLHSIAGLLLNHGSGLTVRSTTGEAFTNEFLAALGDKDLESFKARFRRVDVLLIDDVQFLERKTRTEEEFFHTFNALHDLGSQIVLTSDRPPRDLQALEDRLRERFQAGLVADISPPELATRLTILRKRAQHDDIELADKTVLGLIAERVTTNVRALEGALIRVVAFGSLTGQAITSELTLEVLDGLYPNGPQQRPTATSIAEIQAATCEQFSLSPQELLSPARTARVAWPRQMAMYLARELTEESLPAIGRQFGGRDHTTVLHAQRRAEQRMAKDPTSRKAVDELRQRLGMTTTDR
jgi:chromosomal replication initiator protein